MGMGYVKLQGNFWGGIHALVCAYGRVDERSLVFVSNRTTNLEEDQPIV
jgi:hypothetical protein